MFLISLLKGRLGQYYVSEEYLDKLFASTILYSLIDGNVVTGRVELNKKKIVRDLDIISNEMKALDKNALSRKDYQKAKLDILKKHDYTNLDASMSFWIDNAYNDNPYLLDLSKTFFVAKYGLILKLDDETIFPFDFTKTYMILETSNIGIIENNKEYY